MTTAWEGRHCMGTKSDEIHEEFEWIPMEHLISPFSSRNVFELVAYHFFSLPSYFSHDPLEAG